VKAARARAILAALTILITVLAVSSVRLDSATADEGAHIAAGLVRLQHGSFRFFAEQPPLMNVLSAIPLALDGVRVPPLWQTENHWTVGHALLYLSGYSPPRILFLARLPTIALFLALCVAVWWFVRDQTGSETWALVAFLMTGLCPNLLAHGRLATVDLAATAFLFIATALFLRLLREPSKAVAIGASAAAACAILSKTSGLIVGPWLALLLVVHLVRRRPWRPLVVPLVLVFASSVVVVYATYLLLARDQSLAGAITLPFREYAQSVEHIRHWYTKGHEHPQFLMGEFSRREGWPHYYFVAFLLKVPIGAQILFLVSCVIAVRRRSAALLTCVGFVFLVLAISATSHIDLGIRYVLPIFPFVYAAIAIALADAARDAGPHRKALGILVAALIAWHALAGVLAYPSYISYFNEWIGSPRNADRFLIDSNLDWGQDLHRLRLWCDANGVEFIRVDYFGGGEPRYELGPRAERWPAPRRRLLPKGWFALSRHFYRTSFDPLESPVDYDTYLAASKARYVTTVGGSIDVYRVD